MVSIILLVLTVMLLPLSVGARPNILIIMMDDLGYHDLGYQGSNQARTPAIDRLAAQGVRFTNAYASGNVCTPTRAALMSGRYQQSIGVEDVDDVLPRRVQTLAQRLKAVGYATGMAGKWHLGDAAPFRPIDRGFDSYYGHLQRGRNIPGPLPIWRNNRLEPLTEYLPDAMATEAVRFITAHSQDPWFFYLAYNAVHVPLAAPLSLRQEFPASLGSLRRTYLATLLAVDRGIQRIVSRLAQLNQLDNTLIVFANDNGGPTGTNPVMGQIPQGNTANNAPLRGRKGQTYEGGIRVPMVVRWPGVFPAGAVFRQPVITMDITATVLTAAGAPRQVTDDGVDLRQFLHGETPHPALYWRNRDRGNAHAIREGAWKLVWSPPVNRYQLFRLDTDISETLDLSRQFPEKVKALRARYTAWSAQVDAEARR